MARLALYLLGPAHVERDGVSAPIDCYEALALLVYVAVSGGQQR